jgi:hypothetical protein
MLPGPARLDGPAWPGEHLPRASFSNPLGLA